MCGVDAPEPYVPPEIVEPLKPPPAPEKTAKAPEVKEELNLPRKPKGLRRLSLRGEGVGVNVPTQ
jgi:hypothetical protein